jgi:hypothetical protein
VSRTDRPLAVRRWARRPLLWTAAALALAGWLVYLDRQGAADQDAQFSDGVRVTGVPAVDWDGGADLEVVYEHPSGQVVRADTYVSHTELLGAPGEPVDLEVSDANPTDVRIVGDDNQPSNPLQYLFFAVPFILGWVARRRSLVRSERLAASEAVAYQMRAVASSPGFWSWRWRIHLYALDSVPTATPVCTAPLIEAPAGLGDRIVEVKGTPRPWGRVMVRDQETGQVLWPTGRCLRSYGWGRRSLEPGRPAQPRVAGRMLAAAGVVLFAAGGIVDSRTQDSSDSEERRYQLLATVVSQTVAPDDRDPGGYTTVVEVDWLGSSIVDRVHSSDPIEPGGTMPVFIDPAEPRRVWAPGQDAPGGNWVGALYAFGLLALGAAAIVRVGARTEGRGGSTGGLVERLRWRRGHEISNGTQWRGLYVDADRLHYRPPTLWGRRATLRFEPDGLAVIARNGDVELLPWSAGHKAWRLVAQYPSRSSRGGIRVVNVPAQTDLWNPTYGTQDVWLPSTWTTAPLDELPALVDYLIETPAARAGLSVAHQQQRLIRELANRAWQRPPVPEAPVLGDRLDVFIAVDRVLNDLKWRRFGGRPVRGEPSPEAHAVASIARVRLLRGVSERVSDQDLLAQATRHLAVGRWPFDVLGGVASTSQ